MKSRRIIGTILAVLCLAGLAVVAWEASHRPANLMAVREAVTPRLRAEMAEAGFEFGQPIFIRVFKESSELELWVRSGDVYDLFKTYPICNYSGELGPKLEEGDRQSPEGFYFVTPAQMNPNSQYHLSFNLGFPNAYDRAHARTGSYLMIHGDCLSVGCYAMTDAGIEEIYLLAEAAFAKGQPFFRVQIFPFRMTQQNLARNATSPWREYWDNLKEGYDLFEQARIPPNVTVVGKRYAFDVEGARAVQ